MTDILQSYWDEVYTKNDPKPEGSHGWIQWKGTNVCMDTHCVCGYHGHIDADFFYYYQCPKCQRKFAVGQNVKLIEMTPTMIDLYKQSPWTKNEEPDFKTCDLEEEE